MDFSLHQDRSTEKVQLETKHLEKHVGKINDQVIR